MYKHTEQSAYHFLYMLSCSTSSIPLPSVTSLHVSCENNHTPSAICNIRKWKRLNHREEWKRVIYCTAFTHTHVLIKQLHFQIMKYLNKNEALGLGLQYSYAGAQTDLSTKLCKHFHFWLLSLN